MANPTRRGTRVTIIKPEGQRFQCFTGSGGTVMMKGETDREGMFGRGWFLVSIDTARGAQAWYHEDELHVE